MQFREYPSSADDQYVLRLDAIHRALFRSSMNTAERDFFKLTAEGLGFTVELHPNPNHWHLITPVR